MRWLIFIMFSLKECKNTETVVIGKREPGAPPDPAHSHGASHASHEQDGGTEMCNYCCSHNGCNLNLCGKLYYSDIHFSGAEYYCILFSERISLVSCHVERG